MRSFDTKRWAQFDRFIRSGVPDALDIARALASSNLTFPKSPNFDQATADVLFYGPVHTAYRHDIIVKFLTILELLRSRNEWEYVRQNRPAQQLLIDIIMDAPLREDFDIVSILASHVHGPVVCDLAQHASGLHNPTRPQYAKKAA